MSTEVMIEARELSKSFGAVQALDKVSFQVRRGEVVGFLGPNGAGKSTTMRILTCFIAPTNGTATVHGHDVFEDSLAVRRALGYLPQRAPLYQDMTVQDYLRFAADIRGVGGDAFKDRLKQVVEVCGLARVLEQLIGTLSHGYRQRVGLGQALLHNPPILILDEPTSDLDPNEKAELLRYIKEIGKDRTILLSTHNLSEVEEACARAIIISSGRVVADGSLDDIRGGGDAKRYIITLAVDETHQPTAEEAAALYAALPGVTGATPQAAEAGTVKLAVTAKTEKDLRGEIFRAAADRGWVLLESRRETVGLDAIFRALTVEDEAATRGKAASTRPRAGN